MCYAALPLPTDKRNEWVTGGVIAVSQVSTFRWGTRVGSRPASGQPFPAGTAPHAITVFPLTLSETQGHSDFFRATDHLMIREVI
jgi:hypothetical protein